MLQLRYNDSFLLTNQKHLASSFDWACIDEQNDKNIIARRGLGGPACSPPSFTLEETDTPNGEVIHLRFQVGFL